MSLNQVSLNQDPFSQSAISGAGKALAVEGSSSAGERIPLVLVADDDDDSLVLMSYALELLGVTFIATKSGHEAMAISNQYEFSLILLDILLPDADGIQICQWLRQNPRTWQVPVVAVTALAQPADRDRILKAGFTDYLVKPYMLEDLNSLIQRCLS
ncbi:MAG: response regulator [Cyanobacteria bacterium P01_A01_bin.114]